MPLILLLSIVGLLLLNFHDHLTLCVILTDIPKPRRLLNAGKVHIAIALCHL